MRRYLTHRAGPASVPIPRDLSGLRGRAAPVGVTLRRQGTVVAVHVRDEGDLLRNVIAAALQAMRSSKLPDRVDRKVLEALTVEVDVLSPRRPVEQGELAGAFVPGLTGIAYARCAPTTVPARRRAGRSWVLPAAGYILGLDAGQMRRGAMIRFRLTSANASLPPRLEVFTTRHFVGLPGGRFVELYRGKDLSRRTVRPEAFDGAAEMVGRFLAVRQRADGRYTNGEKAPPLRDHLYATWAMARLASKPRHAGLSESVAKAIAHAVGLAERRSDEAWLPAEDANNPLVETSLLSLALAAAPGTGPDPLSKPLARWIVSRLAATKASQAARPLPSGPYLAILALRSGPGAEELPSILRVLKQHRPADVVAKAWACRAGVAAALLPGGGRTATQPAITQRGADALADEVGGVCRLGGAPETVLTGLAAACWGEARKQLSGTAAERIRRRWMAARTFCHAMMYQPDEAYYAADPATWVGGVRSSPARAEITVAACAAAMDALLAE